MFAPSRGKYKRESQNFPLAELPSSTGIADVDFVLKGRGWRTVLPSRSCCHGERTSEKSLHGSVARGLDINFKVARYTAAGAVYQGSFTSRKKPSRGSINFGVTVH